MIYGKRIKVNTIMLHEPNTIAIAYKTNEWVLVDYEVIESSDFMKWSNLAQLIPPNDHPKSRVAILCTLKNLSSNETIVLGNIHLEHEPRKDESKFGQAVYYIEKIASYIRQNRTQETLPFISGGDFNSLPISSVLSAFYNENIFAEDTQSQGPSLWTIPADLCQERRAVYKEINRIF